MATVKRIISAVERSGFVHCYYLLSASTDKFDVEQFLSALKKIGRGDDATKEIAFFPAENVDEAPYYLVVTWFVDDGEINFRIEFTLGVMPPVKGARGPHAETFMTWFGKFFTYTTAHSHMHAYFEYPLKGRQSRFPLPIKTNLPGDSEAFEIFGVTVRISSKPHGVLSLKLTRGKSQWLVEVTANQRVTFGAFSLEDDVTNLSAVAETFLERKQ